MWYVTHKVKGEDQLIWTGPYESYDETLPHYREINAKAEVCHCRIVFEKDNEKS